jgi:mannose-6-phosphate isomerase-like protein (cupin superfamily)
MIAGAVTATFYLRSTTMKGNIALFSARNTPLLNQGSSMDLLARAPSLYAHIKVYADGGENGLHNHPNEDHLFYILQGQATFTMGSGDTIVAERNQGVIVPRGAMYSFVNSGTGNLILLRIGTPTTPDFAKDIEGYPGVPLAAAIREDADGRKFSGDDARNRTGAQRGVKSGALFDPSTV